MDSAAAAYTEYCLKDTDQAGGYEDKVEAYTAFQYLADYHLKKGQLDEAHAYAYKCLEHEETKEQGKAVLKSIQAKRETLETQPTPMDDSTISVGVTDANMSSVEMVFSPKT